MARRRASDAAAQAHARHALAERRPPSYHFTDATPEAVRRVALDLGVDESEVREALRLPPQETTSR